MEHFGGSRWGISLFHTHSNDETAQCYAAKHLLLRFSDCQATLLSSNDRIECKPVIFYNPQDQHHA